MPDVLVGALQTPGLYYLVSAAILAGIVRGFSGFGTALVYLPVAAQFLSPFAALTTLILMDLVGPLIHVPRALREGHPGDVLRLGLGALLAVPVGLWVLARVDPVVFRWAVSVIALVLLCLLVTGARYRGRLSPPMIFGTGAIGGFFAGSVGLPGPPVIMLYMASSLPARSVRANLMLYLILADLILAVVLWLNGYLLASALVLGLLLILPYTLGNWVGALVFRPQAERVYRLAAYAIITGSALMGLPLWD